MTYSDLKVTVNLAWNAFYQVLSAEGINTVSLDNTLDNKDIFNDVMDCVTFHANLEEE